MIALSNGNISLGDLPLFDNKDKSKVKKVTVNSKRNSSNKRKKIQKENSEKINRPRKSKNKDDIKRKENILGFNIEDINNGIKLMDLSDEDLERGMEIITRTKKYMTKDEKKLLTKVESLLDLVKGIKKLSSIDELEEEESNFFRSMDDEDKKNMMIKEILEVFPEKRKESIEKAIDIKKKIDLFAELFLPDDFGDGGFSISSLANISNLGSISNLNLLGSLLRSDSDSNNEDEELDDEDFEYEEEYHENDEKIGYIEEHKD